MQAVTVSPMTRGDAVTCSVGPMERLPPPVPPRPSKAVVAKALAKTRRAPPPPIPAVRDLSITRSAPLTLSTGRHVVLDTSLGQGCAPAIVNQGRQAISPTSSTCSSSTGSEHETPPEPQPQTPSPPLGRISHWVEVQGGQPVHLTRCEISVGQEPVTAVIPVALAHSRSPMASSSSLQHGLPPLPKSLSGAMDADNLSVLEAEMSRQKKQQRPVPPPRHPPPHPPRHPPHRRHAPSVPPPPPGLPPGLQQHNGAIPTAAARLGASPARPPLPHVSSLDAQLAVLRQEMVSLFLILIHLS